MAEIAYQPEGSDCGDRRFELSRNLNQSERGWHTAGGLRQSRAKNTESAALIVLIL